MFRENKNLKDSSIKDTSSVPETCQAVGFGIVSYTKTNKLITALYMVTDIIDKDEPLRNKLRTLGTGIISDMNSIPSNICNKISGIMSFLDIASAVNIISSMNCNILKKEFLELNQSIKESVGEVKTLNKKIDLSEFFFESPLLNKEGVGGGNSLITTSPFGHSSSTRRREISKGHTSIGVQKGSTLMKALSKVEVSDRTRLMSNNNFDKLKKQRRYDIINIIKTIGGNATIKDIKDRAKSLPNKTSPLFSCGEKTLQRELVSMVKDGVLNKMGEKRWSRYFLK